MTAWKNLELVASRALGAERRPSVGPHGWAQGSDDDGTAPFSMESKYTARYQLRASWLEQAKRQGKADGRPWLLVIREHRRPAIAVLDFLVFAELVQDAGRIGELKVEP